jgi:hypothetical protein
LKRSAIGLLTLIAALVAGCRGFDTIIPDELLWREVAPKLPGTSIAAIEQCTLAPVRQMSVVPGVTAVVYRAADLHNYCEVTLYVRDGRIETYKADYNAFEYLYLRDGTNYCGQIFRSCVR